MRLTTPPMPYCVTWIVIWPWVFAGGGVLIAGERIGTAQRSEDAVAGRRDIDQVRCPIAAPCPDHADANDQRADLRVEHQELVEPAIDHPDVAAVPGWRHVTVASGITYAVVRSPL